MQRELMFTVGPGSAEPARPLPLEEAGLKERADLQEWVRKHPEILGEDVRIVTFEFNAWESRRGQQSDRLDLLGLDGDGRLVVAELKRGTAPDTVEMQAIKYAAFASRFDPDTLAQAHAHYLSRVGGELVSPEDARRLLEEHVGGELDGEQLNRPRIVLMASGFPPSVRATAVWLNEMGLDVAMVQFAAYQAEHDIVLSVSQLWPLPDVGEFTVAPRQAEVRAAEDRSRRRREASVVRKLVLEEALDDGEELFLNVSALPADVQAAAEQWTAEAPERSLATWRNDPREPLVWALNGSSWTPTGLAAEIVERATGSRAAPHRPSRAWRNAEGRTLSELAGYTAGRFDWSRLHEAVAVIEAGEWTTYGDLAELLGTGAQALGNHIGSCADCSTGYRVLTARGEPSANFYWGDPADDRDPRAVLEQEGLTFTNGRADPRRRVTTAMLSKRIEPRRASPSPASTASIG